MMIYLIKLQKQLLNEISNKNDLNEKGKKNQNILKKIVMKLYIKNNKLIRWKVIK